MDFVKLLFRDRLQKSANKNRIENAQLGVCQAFVIQLISRLVGVLQAFCGRFVGVQWAFSGRLLGIQWAFSGRFVIVSVHFVIVYTLHSILKNHFLLYTDHFMKTRAKRCFCYTWLTLPQNGRLRDFCLSKCDIQEIFVYQLPHLIHKDIVCRANI